MGEQDGTISDGMDTVSGNDLPGTEEDKENPGEGENGTGDPSGRPAEPGDPEEGDGQEPGNDPSDPGEEDEEDIPVTTTGDGDAQWREDIAERLEELTEPEDTTDVTERLDALIALLTPEELAEEPEADAQTVPVEGYEDFSYPVNVEYSVLMAGFDEYITDTETYGDPGTFLADYEELVLECGRPGSSFRDFYICYVYDSDNRMVYDYKAQLPEPDPGDEDGEVDPAELLLSHLKDINTTLSGMAQADAEYFQMVKDCQTEMLEMQAASTATDILICIGVFAVFSALVWQWFFGRFK